MYDEQAWSNKSLWRFSGTIFKPRMDGCFVAGKFASEQQKRDTVIQKIEIKMNGGVV